MATLTRGDRNRPPHPTAGRICRREKRHRPEPRGSPSSSSSSSLVSHLSPWNQDFLIGLVLQMFRGDTQLAVKLHHHNILIMMKNRLPSTILRASLWEAKFIFSLSSEGSGIPHTASRSAQPNSPGGGPAEGEKRAQPCFHPVVFINHNSRNKTQAGGNGTLLAISLRF